MAIVGTKDFTSYDKMLFCENNMRCIFIIILISVFNPQVQSQFSKASYLGNASWRKVAVQKKPDPLIYETSSYPVKKISYADSPSTMFYRKVDPGTITFRKGPTLPVSEPLKIIGKKLGDPQIIQALPLQIRDNAEFNIHYTDKKHGFPALSALDFAEDENHDMWIVTERGVIRYDGYYYRYYKQPDHVPELQESSTLFDHQKRLWVASSNGLYFIKNDSVFTIQHSEIDFSALDCKEVIMDQFQRIWIPTKSFGAICIDGNTVKVYDKRCGLPNNFVEALYVDKKGNLLMASREHGIVLIEPDKMRMFFSKSKNIVYHNFLAFYEDDNGIWASCYGAGLFRLSPTDTLQYSFTGRYNEVILDMKKAPKGIWISCYGKAVFYLSENNLLKINETNGLLNNAPMRIFIDSFDNLWVSNISGFSRINDNRFYLDRFPNKAMGHINEIIQDRKQKGDWLITFSKGLLFRKDNQVTAYSYTAPYGSYRFDHFNGAVLNKDGSLWLGAYGEGIIRANKNRYTLYKYSNFSDNLVMITIKEDAINKVWFCPNRYGLILYDKEQFWHYTKKSGLISDNVLNIFSDPNKTIHWTFTQGIQRLKNESIETFYLNNQPFKDKVNKSVQVDDKKTLWGTDKNGLLLLDGEQIFQFTKANGLLSNTINSMIKDAFGKIWITSDKGVESFELRDHTLYNHEVFNKANGSYLLDPVDVFIDTTGLPYWVIGTKKLVFNPAFTPTKNNKPFLHFTEILVNNQLTQTNKISIFPDKKISLTYKTIFWGMENNLQLSYLLISNKNDTTERPIQNTDKILLSDVLPGNYKVVLKAINNHDVYYSNPINVIVYNFWYNSWIFRISIGVITLLFVISYFRRKAKQQLKINALLEEKVKEQTATILQEKNTLEKSLHVIDTQNKEKEILIEEINHRVKNNLQFIIAMLEMQMNKQYSKEALQALLSTSRRIKAMSLVHELLYAKPDKAGLSMTSYIYELIDNLKEMAEGGNEHSVDINLSIDDIIFDSRKALSIGMIISELVSNSFKHAFKNIQKPQIFIQLKKNIQTSSIELIVEDNGNGFTTEVTNGTGLGRRLVDIFSRQLEGAYELATQNQFRFKLVINHTAV